MATCVKNYQNKLNTASQVETEAKIENMYNLAEECYRWMGDVRGLADTLDYFGYYYLGKKSVEQDADHDEGYLYKVNGDNEIFKYKALSKWQESKNVWENQGKTDKIVRREREIEQLKKGIEEYKQDCEEREEKEKQEKQKAQKRGE